MKPPAPTFSEIPIGGTGEEPDILAITCPTGGTSGSTRVFLSFELLSQDLIYAYESATNQLVFAQGDESAPVQLKDRVFQVTSTFLIRLDPSRRGKDAGEDFTLRQLKAIVEALFEFGHRFRTRNIEFSYKLQGKSIHLTGFLQFEPPETHATAPTSSADIHPTSNFTTHNTSIITAGGRTGASDPHQTRAWDPLRLHPAAKIT